MRILLQVLLLALLIISLKKNCIAEGSYEFQNGSCSNYGSIQIWDNNDSQRNFATYNCSASSRLNIRLLINEHLYFGYATDVEDVYYRIKEPNGNIVKGPTLITSSSSRGWISTCNKAIIGPDSSYAGGYKCLGIKAAMSGDYYIEFAVNNNATNYAKRIFTRFDLTVSSAGTVKEGRVWSKMWDFTTSGSTNPFTANLYAYTIDSVVTKINFNGIKPFGFTVSCNSYGASDIGSLLSTRKSNYKQSIINSGGAPGAPEFKIFLNDPDSVQFPTGTVGEILSVVLETCRQDTNCVTIIVTKAGQVEVKLIFPNGTSKTYIQNVLVGSNCIIWDGKNGDGIMVSTSATIQIQTKYLSGITHLPMTDVEENPNGFIVSLQRPSNDGNGNPFQDPLLYWNDSLMTDPGNSIDGILNLDGCTGSCHKWTARGTNNSNPEVINTWWYISQQMDTTFQSCNIVLALELIDFSGRYFNYENQIKWITATAGNIHHFELERSFDNLYFSTIALINSKSNSDTCFFFDKNLLLSEDIYYYRLRIIDQSNDFSISNVIVLQSNRPTEKIISVYPNPNDGRKINFFLSGITADFISLNLFNVYGEIVFYTQIKKNGAGNFSEQFILEKLLINGSYLISCITDKENFNRILIVK